MIAREATIHPYASSEAELIRDSILPDIHFLCTLGMLYGRHSPINIKKKDSVVMVVSFPQALEGGKVRKSMIS